MSPLRLESFVTRKARYSYCGQQLELALSQSLFSSHEVDRGSALLLKSLARHPLAPGATVLDLGSGTGVLGIALARARQGARVWFQDRDALAVAFSSYNCRANSVEPARLSAALALQDIGDTAFDLIVSNLPAKAGEPVHADIARRIACRLVPGGLTAIVVVEPLADRTRRNLELAGLEAAEAERTTAHVVFHARRADAPAPGPGGDVLAPYIRSHARFQREDVGYGLATVYDLPEFDTPSYHTALAQEIGLAPALLERLARPILVWNPGQGHVPAFLAAAATTGPITLAGRDALALAISARNTAGVRTRCVHTWDPAECGGPFGCVFATPDDDPHVGWDSCLPGLLRAILEPDGLAVVSGSATFVGRFLKSCHGLVLHRSRKKSGARSVLLRSA